MVKFFASRNLFANGAWLTQGDEIDVSGFRAGAVKEMLSKGDIFVDASRYVDVDSVTGPEGSFVTVVDGSLQPVRNISQLEAKLFGQPVSPEFYISPDADPSTGDGTENDPFHSFTQVTLAVKDHLLAGGDKWATLEIYLFPGNYSNLADQQVVNQFLNGANHSCYLIKPSQWNASRMDMVNRYPHRVVINLHGSGQAVFDKPLYFSNWNQIDIGFPWSWTTEGIAAPFIYIADGADWGKTYIYADSLFVDNLVLDNMGFNDLYLGPAQFTPPSGAPGILIKGDTYVEGYLWSGHGDNGLISLRYPRVGVQDRSALVSTHSAMNPDGEVRDFGNVLYRNGSSSMDVIDGGSL